MGDTEGVRKAVTEQQRGKLSQGGHSGPRESPHSSLVRRTPTHQTAEVWPVEPGGGETQGHVRGAFSHLS